MKKIYLIIMGFILVTVSSFIIINNNVKNNKQYLVTFDSNGGTPIESLKVKKNSLVSKPNDPEKEGYVFLGWTENGKVYDFNTKITNNITLVASYEIKKENVENYIIKFDTDGGSAILDQVVEKNENVKMPEKPVREGYTFIGWYLDDDAYNFDTPVIKNLILKAKWEKEKSTNNKANNSLNNNSNNNSNSLKLRIPALTITEQGGDIDSWGVGYKVTNIEAADGIELYKSTTGNDYILEKSFTSTQLAQNNMTIGITVYVGEHNYYKVRAYKNVNGKKVYSDYTSVFDLKGPILRIPTLTITEQGGDIDSWGVGYKVTNIEAADGIELYKSTTGNDYILEKSFTSTQLAQNNMTIGITVYVGEHNYYKVRAYKNVNGKKVYSDYSDVEELSY